MMTTDEARETLNCLKFRNWNFELSGTVYTQCFLRVSFWTHDNWNAHSRIKHRGRKWAISQHMTKSELVQTALLAVLQAQEHEAREQFLYKGKAVFGPHYDVEALLDIADRTDVRKES